MNWKELLGLDWSCGRCNIITKGKSHGDIRVLGAWKPMCKSCCNEMEDVARALYPEYNYND